MTHTIRLPPLAGAIAAAFCLVTLAFTASNEAVAQGVPGSVIDQAYYNGYGAGYNSRYGNAYGAYGYGSRYGYTGYGNGPYGYRSPAPYGYPATGYGYSNGTYNSLYYRALRLHGGSYRPIYNPNVARYYSPYGREGY